MKRITPDTDVRFVGHGEMDDVQAQNIEDLMEDVELDGDEITSCTIDLDELYKAAILYTSMERQRQPFRRSGSK